MKTHLGRIGTATGALVAAVALLAACSSAGSSSSPPTSSSSSGGAAQTQRGNGARFGGPAASGLVAAINGRTVQVQNQQSGQVAVTYSAKTAFSRTVATTIAKIKKGDCVTAMAPSGTSSSATSFTAARISVTSPVNGSCTGGFGGPRPTGTGPSGTPPTGGPFPSGAAPSGAPTGVRVPGGAPNFGAVASGTVRSVSGSKIVVAARQFNSTSTKPMTVRAGRTTKVTTTAAATAKSLRVGRCVTAQGSTNSSGAVKATRIQVDPATNGQCTFGFGGPNGQ